MLLALLILGLLTSWVLLMLLFEYRLLPWLGRRLNDGDPVSGLMKCLAWWVTRVIHRTTYIDWDRIPAAIDPDGRPGRGLIIAANHTAGIDPLLVQVGIDRHIRWMMWDKMMVPQLDALWRRERIIPISMDQRDSTSVREAIRHLKAGGTIGIFPEGAIERPGRQLRPFHPGVGLLARMSGVPVVAVWISGTPYKETAYGSLLSPSHSRLQAMGPFEYGKKQSPEEISEHLRQQVAQASGWPLNDEQIIEHETPPTVGPFGHHLA